MATCGCAARGTAPCCSATFTCSAGRCRSAETHFELTRGDINFANPFRLDPVLNVEATSTINQYQVTIDFSGPASHLALNYRSDPPLPDSDIVALLALGSPGKGAGCARRLALRKTTARRRCFPKPFRAGSAGGSNICSESAHSAWIRSSPARPRNRTPPRASRSRNRSPHDLTITYSTNAATSNQYQLIQVEYAVKRDLSVVFLRDIKISRRGHGQVVGLALV